MTNGFVEEIRIPSQGVIPFLAIVGTHADRFDALLKAKQVRMIETVVEPLERSRRCTSVGCRHDAVSYLDCLLQVLPLIVGNLYVR